jgi:hypothetical protein
LGFPDPSFIGAKGSYAMKRDDLTSEQGEYLSAIVRLYGKQEKQREKPYKTY